MVQNYASLDSNELAKVSSEKDRNVFNAALLSEIDKTMKKHNDNLLHALEGVSARLSQLESRNRNLENSLDDLKLSVGNNYGSIDGKLRQLENILRDVSYSPLDSKSAYTFAAFEFSQHHSFGCAAYSLNFVASMLSSLFRLCT